MGNPFTPVVSIVIPAYNVASYIGETLQSILQQSYQAYEVLVVNDGSTDATEQVVLAFEDLFQGRLRYLKKPNGGPSTARNAAIRQARGRFIALLDGDDLWLPGYLEHAVTRLEADSQTDVFYPNAEFFGRTRFAGKTFQEINPSTEPVTWEKLLSRECMVFISAVFRREILDKVGLLDESPDLIGAEDFDLWLRMGQQGYRFSFTREVLVRYRRRDDALSASAVRIRRATICVYNKLLAQPELSTMHRQIIEERVVNEQGQLHLALAHRQILAGEYESAQNYLTLANTYYRRIKIIATQVGLRVAPALVAAYIRREQE